MTIQGWLNSISLLSLFGDDKPTKARERSTPRHPSPSPRYHPKADTPPTSLFDFLFRTKEQPAQIRREEQRTCHQKVVDSHFGFVPLSRRFEFDIEACRILGRALRAGGLGREGYLPRVWTEPTKAQMREIGRLGRKDGYRWCMRLVATPQIQMAEAVKIWEELERFFWVSEGERAALEKARGRWSFTEVPVELLVDREMRRGLIERVKRDGNVEQDGQVVLERMGERRRPYGAVVAKMSVIEEADDDADEDEVKGVVDSGRRVGDDLKRDDGGIGEAISEWTDVGTDKKFAEGLAEGSMPREACNKP